MKKQYQLSFVHKLLGGALLVLGIIFLLKTDTYSEVVNGWQTQKVTFPFLQRGDYVLEVFYQDSPEGNVVSVYSDDFIGEDNIPGEVFVSQEMEEGTGIVRFPLHFDQEVYNVRVKTEADAGDADCLHKVHLQKVQSLSRDHYFLSAICIVAAACIIWLGWFVPAERYLPPMAMVGLGLLASLPLFSESLPTGDDLMYHLARMEGLYQGLRAGEFPVRINAVQTAGFGNLSATMYPQLFLYPVVLLRFARVSLMLCYKILVVCLNIGTALLTFYSAKSICKSEKIGCVASALYTFSVYRLNNVYFRAALGEALAMVFLPLVIWGLYEVLWGDRKKWYLLMLGMTGVIQSHVLSVELCIFFMVLETLFWLGAKRFRGIGSRIAAGWKATVGCFLLNASFLVPFLYYSGKDLQIFHMESEVADSVVYLSQMFFTFPLAVGKNLERGTTTGEMTLAVGSVLLMGSILFCAMAAGKEKVFGNGTHEIAFGKHCLCLGLLSLFLASWLFPWDVFNKQELFLKWTTPLQFAWRMLGPASVFLCMVSAVGIVWFAEKKSDRKWIFGVVLLLLICSTGYFFDGLASERMQYSDKMELEGNSVSDSMYMYWEGEKFQALHLNYSRSDGYVKVVGEAKAGCFDFRKNGTHVHVQVDVESQESAGELLFPLYYYPGYEITINGEKVEAYSRDRLVACEMPKEDALVEVHYRGLTAFRVADIVTLVSILGMAGYIIKTKLRKKAGKVVSK